MPRLITESLWLVYLWGFPFALSLHTVYLQPLHTVYFDTDPDAIDEMQLRD